MKGRRESIAIAAIIVLAILVTGIATYDLLSPHNGQGQQGTTQALSAQPVVDVILPSLFRQQGSNSQNAPLNVTSGQNVTLEVDVYTTVSLNLKMQYAAFLLPSGYNGSTSSQGNPSIMSATFNPQTLNINGGAKGISTLRLSIPPTALLGEYSAVISAINVNNSTQTWGDIFQIFVTA